MASLSALEKKEYKIIIVSDTLSPWAVSIQDGFKETLDKQLAAGGAKAAYQVFDTKLDPKTIPDIQAAIDKTKPDLICTINYPTVFADNQITKNPANAGYRFVSENCIPVQSGLIKDTKVPGGNVTGVGVFLQFNSPIKLMKMINPQVKKLAYHSWDAMGVLNDWFEQEVRQSAKEEGIELVEFRRVASFEEEVAMLGEYDKKDNTYFLMGGISAFVHKDGSPVQPPEGDDYIRSLKHLQYIAYDETAVQRMYIGGTCVVWYDIGAQLSDKALKILNGTKPGSLPWEYPRKYNIILNRQAAKDKGIEFSSRLTSAAYRIYTDYEGNFTGKKN
jgi:putative ABC transport system substrate-binding protein